MKSIFVLLMPMIVQGSAMAQTRLMTLYEQKHGSTTSITRNVIFLHAVNDSVYYTTQTKGDGTNQKYPSGSEFIIHSFYINWASGLHLSQSPPGSGTRYLIVDTLENWIYLDSTKNILGYNCKRSAIIQEGPATIAWYAPAISTTLSPFGYGGLPAVDTGTTLPVEQYKTQGNQHKI